MIKINLLGDSTKLDYTNRFILFGLFLGFLLVAMSSYWLYGKTNDQIKRDSVKLTNLEEELRGLQSKTKVVKELESKKDVLRQKLLLLAKLRKNKIGPVRVLDDLNIAVPDGIWVRDLDEKDQKITIQGRALDNQSIALFIKQLAESSFYSAVDLVESRQVYYSKKTGQVTSTPDTGGRNSGNKSKTFQERQKKLARSGQISENNIRIKDFIIKANVNYAGNFTRKTEEVAVEEQLDFPELRELENL